MENVCVFHETFEKRLDKVEEHGTEIDNKINLIEKDTLLDRQKFSMLLDNLSKLPEAINEMNKTMRDMQDEIKSSGDKTTSLEKSMKKLTEKVDTIDEEGKFSIRGFIKEHFVGVIISVSCLVAYGTHVVSNLFN